MLMFKFFYGIDDSQPAFYLQSNPQNRDVYFDDFWIVDIAKRLRCKRIDKITNSAEYLRWWVAE